MNKMNVNGRPKVQRIMDTLKKFGKYFWKTTIALIAVGVFLFSVVFIGMYMKYLDENSVLSEVSENVEIRYLYNQDKTAIYNKAMDEYTIKDLQWASNDYKEDSLSVFCKNDKRGFYHIYTGEEVIRAHYNRAWIVSEGLAAVELDGKIGFVNEKDELVLPFEYDYANRNGRPVDYLFRDHYCIMTNERGACGLIDKKGEWVVKPLYDCIWPPHFHKYRIVKDGDMYGLLDNNLDFKYPVEYDYIQFSDSEEALYLTKDGYKQKVDFDGNVLESFVFDEAYPLRYPLKVAYYPIADDTGGMVVDTMEKVLSDYMQYSVDGKCGVFCKTTGEVIIPAIYFSIEMISETLFEASIELYGANILIDTHGRIVEHEK